MNGYERKVLVRVENHRSETRLRLSTFLRRGKEVGGAVAQLLVPRIIICTALIADVGAFDMQLSSGPQFSGILFPFLRFPEVYPYYAFFPTVHIANGIR